MFRADLAKLMWRFLGLFRATAVGFVCDASKPIWRPVDLPIFQSEANRETALTVIA
jgi:hypothetical protein